VFALAFAGVIGALVSGRSVTAAVVGVGAVAGLAAIEDLRSRCIANDLMLVGAACVGVGALAAVVLDGREPSRVVGDVLLGVVASGVCVLAAIWVLRPGLIGGGDVKLLGVLGAALGLFAPLVAGLVGPVAVLVAGGMALAARSRRVALGPGLVVGFLVAAVAGATTGSFDGGFG
jgi:leader peptidase (prepilin peptidase)/N-methyltransferase